MLFTDHAAAWSGDFWSEVEIKEIGFIKPVRLSSINRCKYELSVALIRHACIWTCCWRYNVELIFKYTSNFKLLTWLYIVQRPYTCLCMTVVTSYIMLYKDTLDGQTSQLCYSNVNSFFSFKIVNRIPYRQ